MWWESDTATGHIYYNDGNTSQWVQFNGGAGSGGGSSYSNSNVDTHLNTSSATSGQVLSWNGSDYAWVADQTGGGGSGITTANINADTINSGTLNVTGVSTLGVTTVTDFLTSQFESVGYSTFKGRVVFDEILEFRGLEIGGANNLDFYDSSSLLRHSIGYDGTHFTVGGGDSVRIDSSLAGDVKISRGGVGIATFTESGLNVTGVVTATSFSGDGSALTNLNIPPGFNELDAALFN